MRRLPARASQTCGSRLMACGNQARCRLLKNEIKRQDLRPEWALFLHRQRQRCHELELENMFEKSSGTTKSGQLNTVEQVQIELYVYNKSHTTRHWCNHHYFALGVTSLAKKVCKEWRDFPDDARHWRHPSHRSPDWKQSTPSVHLLSWIHEHATVKIKCAAGCIVYLFSVG
jgi:hypothetical protein